MPDATPNGRRGCVLVGYDGSHAANAAVSWAAREASLSARPLLIARCYETPLEFTPLVWTPVGLPPDGPRVEHCVRTVHELAAHCRSDQPGLEVWTEVRAGRPRDVLAALAQENDANLTVVGCADHGRLSRLLLGSTAADLVRSMTRPVVVVHETGHNNAGDRGPVLLHLTGDEDGEAIEFAFDYAARHHCQVHCAQHKRSAPETFDPWRVHHPEVEVHTEVLVDGRQHALVERSTSAQLLVTRSHHPTALFDASCPAAVIPTATGAHLVER